VIGGGVAALTAARALSAGGASVALFGPAEAIDTEPAGGMVLMGLGEHPAQLLEAVGQAATAEIIGFTRRNADALAERGLLARTGGHHVSVSQREAAGLAAAEAVFRAHGVEARALDLAAARDQIGLPVSGPALHVPGEGLVDPPAALAALRVSGALRGSGALPAARAITSDDDGLVIDVGSLRARAELVVLAGGWNLPALEPWLADKLYPVRRQWMHVRATHDLSGALTAQLGYLLARPVPGALAIGGCRWASAHMATGERDGSSGDPNVTAVLSRVSAEHLLGGEIPAVIEERRAIMAFSCDGLPIVGTMPGRPRLVLCCGWNGRPWSLGCAAGVAVAQGILEGRAEGVPGLFSPRRFL